MDSTLVSFEIDKARYHGGDLEGTSIIRLFQNLENILYNFLLK